MMESILSSGSLPQQPSLPAESTWSRIAAWLVRRRVRITLIVFVALMIEDVATGVTPHGLFDTHDPISFLAVALVVFGLGIRSWAAGVLHKTRELTTTGPYSVVRNPLYIGSFLVMAGFATMIGDRENLYVILGPLAGLYYLQVLHEERVLSGLYGVMWSDYASRVPRLVPRRLPAWRTMFDTWQLKDWLACREYRAAGSAGLGLLIVEAWRWMQ